MSRWRLKGCPRCGGDLFIEKGFDNWYEQCLQCSYRLELRKINREKDSVPAGRTASKIRVKNKE